MEKTIFSRLAEDSRPRDAHGLPEDRVESKGRKFQVMRAIARLHECDEETLLDCVDANESQVKEILDEMMAKNEVEARKGEGSRTKSDRSFALTLNGWGEYLTALGSMYELPE
ncbi:MAG: hypothetical protein OK455_07045 [Thaumarchaeota archaeon]|nr:hypothetical protein [Nitrososphaerota archaeon]